MPDNEKLPNWNDEGYEASGALLPSLDVSEDVVAPVEVSKAVVVEEPKVEEPKVEEPKVEEPKVEEPKVVSKFNDPYDNLNDEFTREEWNEFQNFGSDIQVDKHAQNFVRFANDESVDPEKREKYKSFAKDYAKGMEKRGLEPFHFLILEAKEQEVSDQWAKYIDDAPSNINLLNGTDPRLEKVDPSIRSTVALTYFLKNNSDFSDRELSEDYGLIVSRYGKEILGLEGEVTEERLRTELVKKMEGNLSDISDFKESMAAVQDNYFSGGLAGEAKVPLKYEGAALEEHLRMQKMYGGKVKNMANKVFSSVQASELGEGEGEDIEVIKKDLSMMSKEDIDRVIYLVSKRAENEGQFVDGYFTRWGKTFARAAQRLVMNMETGLESISDRHGEQYAKDEEAFSSAVSKLEDGEDVLFKDLPDGIRGRLIQGGLVKPMDKMDHKVTVDDLNAIEDGVRGAANRTYVDEKIANSQSIIASVEANRDAYWDNFIGQAGYDIEKASLTVPASIPMSALSIANIPLSILAYKGEVYREGLSEGLSPDQANRLSMVSAPIKAYTNRFAAKASTWTNKPFNKILDKISSPTLRRVSKFGAGVISEYGEEMIQDNVDEWAQLTLNAIDEEGMPKPSQARLEAMMTLNPKTWWDKDVFLASLAFGLSAGAPALAVDIVKTEDMKGERSGAYDGMNDLKKKSFLRSVDAMKTIGHTESDAKKVAEAAKNGKWIEAQMLFKSAEEKLTASDVTRRVTEAHQDGTAKRAEIDLVTADPDLIEVNNLKKKIGMPYYVKTGDDTFEIRQEGEETIETSKEGLVMALMKAEQAYADKEYDSKTKRVEQVIEYLKGNVEGEFEVKVTEDIRGLAQDLEEALEGADSDEARASIREGFASRLRAYERAHGLKEGAFKIEQATVRGRNSYNKESGKVLVDLFKGADVHTAIEEFSEGYITKLIQEGSLDKNTFKALLLEYQSVSGDKVLDENSAYKEYLEYFSDLAQAYMMGDIANEQVPTGLREVLKAFLQSLVRILEMASAMKLLKEEGKMNSDFETLLANSVGLSPVERLESATENAKEKVVEDVAGVVSGDAGSLNPDEQSQMDKVAAEREAGADDFDFSVEQSADGRLKPEVGTRGIPLADGRTLTEETTFSIEAWHGTPHEVDEFSTDEIGTGEGAQVYGHGLYFAGNRGVAEWYRDALSRRKSKRDYISYKGDKLESLLHTFSNVHNFNYKLSDELLNYKGDVNMAKRSLEEEKESWQTKIAQDARRVRDGKKEVYSTESIRERIEDIDVALKSLKKVFFEDFKFIETEKHKGNLYKVNLKVDDADLLDWDNTIGEERAKVLEGLLPDWAKEEIDERINYESYSELTGMELYKFLSKFASEPGFFEEYESDNAAEVAAKILSSVGIKGVKYLDGSSRSQGEGTHNYVIFNDADIEIKGANDVDYSIEARDAEYMAAVESGDVEAQQEMVDAAAKLAGFDVRRFFHGTPKGGFDVFDTSKIGSSAGRGRGGFSFTTSKDAAKSYSEAFSKQMINDNDRLIEVNKFLQSLPEDVEIWGMPANEIEADAVNFEGNETLKDVIDSYAHELRSEGHESEANELLSIVDDSSGADVFNPEVKSVYLKPNNPQNLKATSETYAEVLAGKDARNGDLVVDLDNGDQVRIVSNSNQIKSADPVTYDSEGSVIPLSQRFDEGKDSINYSIEVRDAEYAKAVESGDMDKAQSMVDAAAKLAGFDSPKVYHGTNQEFDVFDREKTRDSSLLDKAFFFTDNKKEAEDTYTGSGVEAKSGSKPNVKEVYLKLGDMADLRFDTFDSGDVDIQSRLEEMDGIGLARDLRNAGFDSVVMDEELFFSGIKGNHYAVFDPNQIKSADPVTYDTDGNVIPLSQRFDESKDSINYSVGLKTSEGEPISVAQPSLGGRMMPMGKALSIQTTNGMVLTGAANFSIGAHHGTDRNIGRFSLDFVGQGAGAQVYGFGLYFTEIWKVAKNYRDKLKGRGSKEANIYTVNLKAKREEFIEFDKALEDQSEYIQNILNDFAGLEGGEIIAMLNERMGSPKKASQYLNRLGVKGVKYLDWDAKLTGEDKYNFVIFNDADIEIKSVNQAPEGESNYAIEKFEAVKNELLPRNELEQKAFDKVSSTYADRSPHLAVAAVRLRNGDIDIAEYQRLVDELNPWEVKGVVAPSSIESIKENIPKNKVGQVGSVVEAGKIVELRIDIPTYNKSAKKRREEIKSGVKNPSAAVYAITAHEPSNSSKAGAPIAYSGAAYIKSPAIYARPESKKGEVVGAMGIAEGGAKFPLATIRGELVTNDSNSPDMPSAEELKTWTEVGYNPTRSSQFRDVRSGRALKGGEESVSIGSRVYVKNPEFMEDSDFGAMDYSIAAKEILESKGGLVKQIYLKETDKFKQGVKSGRIKTDVDIRDFIDMHLVMHQPDTAMAGEVLVDGESFVKGKGGVYYPVLFADDGYFWASTAAKAEEMAGALNEIGERNGGKIYMALTSADVDKLFSSTTMSVGTMNFFKQLTKNPRKYGLTEIQLNRMLTAASKVKIVSKTLVKGKDGKPVLDKKGKKQYNIKEQKFGYEMPKGAKIDQTISTLEGWLQPYNRDKSTGSSFDVRKAFVFDLMSRIADHLKKSPAKAEAVAKLLTHDSNKFAKGSVGKGKLSKAAFVQGLGDMLSEPLTKTFQQFGSKGKGYIYAVIEIDGKVKAVDTDGHESYPKAIVSAEGKLPVVHVLKEGYHWTDVVKEKDTGARVERTPKEMNKVYPTGGFSAYKGRPIQFGDVQENAQKVELNYSIAAEEEGVTLGDVITQLTIQNSKDKAKIYAKMRDRVIDIQMRSNSFASGKYIPIDIEEIDKRTRKSFKKENSMRYALRVAELEDEYINKLYDEYGHLLVGGGEYSHITDFPAHKLLMDTGTRRGILESKTARLKREGATEGDYDDMAMVHRGVWGGDMNPADAASYLYNNNAIPEESLASMWQVLDNEFKSSIERKNDLEKIEKLEREAKEKARTQAKSEVDAWQAEAEAEQTKAVERNERSKIVADKWNRVNVERRRMEDTIRDLARLDAMIKVMPPAVRARVGGFTQLAKIKSAEGREAELKRRLGKIEQVLERELVKDKRKKVRKLIDKSNIKYDKQSRRNETKIGIAGTYVNDAVKKAIGKDKKSEDEISADEGAALAMIEEQKLQSKIDDENVKVTEEDITKHTGAAIAYELFADFTLADSVRLDDMLDFLEQNYTSGRKQWLAVLEERKEWREQTTKKLMSAIGADKPVTGSQLTSAQKRGEEKRRSIRGVGQSLTNFYQFFGFMAEKTKKAEERALIDEMRNEFRRAVGRYEDELLERKDSLDKFLFKLFGQNIKSLVGKAKVDVELGKLSKSEPHGVTSLVGKVVEKKTITIEEAEMIISGVDGSYDGIILSSEDITSLEDAYEQQYNALEEDAQRRKKKIKFDVVIEKGVREPIGNMSQLDLLKDWLAVQQADLREKYAMSGFDDQYVEELEQALSPEAMQIGLFLQGELRKMTPSVNEAHEREYGLTMNQIENYFPAIFNNSRSNDSSNITIDGVEVGQTSTKPSSFKSRVSHNSTPKVANALHVYYAHLNNVIYWKHMSEIMRKYGGALRSKNMQDAVVVKMGQEYAVNLNSTLKNIEGRGVIEAEANIFASEIAGRLGAGVAMGVLGLKLKTILLNVSGMFNVALEVPASALYRGMKNLTTEDVKEVWESNTFQKRLKEGSRPEVIYALRAGKSAQMIPAMSQRAAELGMVGISVADAASNMTVVLAYSERKNELIEAGYDKAQAVAEALDYVDDIMAKSAQPTNFLSKSLYEGSVKGVGKFMFMFGSERRKHSSLMAEAFRKILTDKGEISSGMAYQRIVVGVLMYSMFGLLVKNSYRAFVKGEGEEEEPLDNMLSMTLDPKEIGLEALGSIVGGAPLLGDGIVALVSKVLGARSFDSSTNPFMKIQRSYSKLKKMKDAENADEMLKMLIDVVQATGSLLPQTAVASQLANAADDIQNLFANTLGIYISEDAKIKSEVSQIRSMKSEIYSEVLSQYTEQFGNDAEAKHSEYISRERHHRLESSLWDILNDYSYDERTTIIEELEAGGVVPKSVINKVKHKGN